MKTLNVTKNADQYIGEKVVAQLGNTSDTSGAELVDVQIVGHYESIGGGKYYVGFTDKLFVYGLARQDSGAWYSTSALPLHGQYDHLIDEYLRGCIVLAENAHSYTTTIDLESYGNFKEQSGLDAAISNVVGSSGL